MNYNAHEGYTFINDKTGDIEEVKATYKLQMASLERFAKELGYMLVDNLVFISVGHIKGYENTDKNGISFNKRVKYHNYNFWEGGVRVFTKPPTLFDHSKTLGFNLLRMESALDAKLVKLAHLQRKKGKKIRGEVYTSPEIQVQSHMIKFA